MGSTVCRLTEWIEIAPKNEQWQCYPIFCTDWLVLLNLSKPTNGTLQHALLSASSWLCLLGLTEPSHHLRVFVVWNVTGLSPILSTIFYHYYLPYTVRVHSIVLSINSLHRSKNYGDRENKENSLVT